MADARISVAVITRDRRESLLRTLDRLAALPERPEVIVVDNDSGDGTARAVRAHPSGPRLLTPGRNTGALGRNLAVRAATTPYVAFSDDDSWWEPGALAHAADLMDAHRRLGLVAARTLVGEGRAEDPLNAVLAGSPLPGRPGLPGPRVLGFLACASVVRRDAFLEAGGFHRVLFFGGEETLLAYDMAAAGWDVCHVPAVVAHHHPDPDPGLRPGRPLTVLRNAVLTHWLRRPGSLALRETAALAAAGPRGVGGASAGPAGPRPARGPAARRMTDRGMTDRRVADRRVADRRVAVAVITRNRREELLHTLGRLTALPEEPEVVVVDNGSGDGTAEAVARAFPGVTLLRARRNLGAIGRNLAVERLRAPYIAFCDDDTWWEPGSLGRAADLLADRPGLAAVNARIVVEPSGEEDPVVAELRGSPLAGPDWLPGPAIGSFLAAATVIRRDAFRAAGGFHPRLWFGGEEELLATDLMTAGWWLAYVPGLTIHHAASAARDSTRRRTVGLRNTLWFTWLRRPVLPALRRTADLLRTVPRDTASVRAFALAARGLPWVLSERRPVPAQIERRIAALERARRGSPARRYVG
jgi:GT2 family glycosyltransferase